MVRKVARPYRATPSFQPAQPSLSVENNFVGGLKTEFTGLNFPENACTQVDNCVFSIIGDVTRRGGFNLEGPNNAQNLAGVGGAYTSYHWRNAGGDGVSEIFVQQTNNFLSFFIFTPSTGFDFGISNAPFEVYNLNDAAISMNLPGTVECQYADGNGVLFVFNPYCDPIQVTFDPSDSSIDADTIDINIRDYQGVPDDLGVQGDPTLLTQRLDFIYGTHEYNLLNQGWSNVASASWSATSTTVIGSVSGGNFSIPPGTYVLNVGSISPTPSPGDSFTMNGSVTLNRTTGQPATLNISLSGTVTSYSNPNITLSVANSFGPTGGGAITTIVSESWTINDTSSSSGLISTWFNAIGTYPSNADIWWQFKDTSNVFNPSTSSIINTSLPNTRAPAGHFILNAFDLNRTGVSGDDIDQVSTDLRPATGAWFAGRVWYSGVDDTNFADGLNAGPVVWSENIYYSQVITDTSGFQYGNCYSINDPTNETFFDPLPTDGGVISIPGTGSIYKLFPITNGLLVMAQNGIWIITGSAGVGFESTSYVVAKISAIKVLSASSVVDVLGLPAFWNHEGIYIVEQGKDNVPYGHGGLMVQPLTIGTILSFYNNIPMDSKRHAQGSYNPITYVLQWVYRSTEETNITDRYVYDSALSLNIYNKAFYPYTIATTPTSVAGILYMDYTTGNLEPQFKYPCITGSNFSFAEENDFTTYQDWTNQDYTSSFTTGYRIKPGSAFRKWQPVYVNIYSRNSVPSSYVIQAVWDFATTAIGRTSLPQTVVNWNPEYSMLVRRHKLRGHGLVVQFIVNSISSLPFDLMGWAVPEQTAVRS